MLHIVKHLTLFISSLLVPHKVQQTLPPDPPEIHLFIPAPKGDCIYFNKMDLFCSGNWEEI